VDDRLRNIVYIVLAIITIIGATWGASECLHNFVRRPELNARLGKLEARCDRLEEKIIEILRKDD
jgi:hypothetical protein